MAALDTNVLVRYLVRDDVRQMQAAAQWIGSVVERGESLYVPVTVLLELEWMLRASYGFDKNDIVAVFAALLSAMELRIDAESAVASALSAYGQGRADFADCMHVALAQQAGQAPLWTFDKACARVEGASWVALAAPN